MLARDMLAQFRSINPAFAPLVRATNVVMGTGLMEPVRDSVSAQPLATFVRHSAPLPILSPLAKSGNG